MASFAIIKQHIIYLHSSSLQSARRRIIKPLPHFSVSILLMASYWEISGRINCWTLVGLIARSLHSLGLLIIRRAVSMSVSVFDKALAPFFLYPKLVKM